MRHDVSGLLHHLAIAPDAVARDVGADVEVDPERGNTGIADIGHADNGAWFRIELAEPVKRGRELLRQDREIALDETVGDPGRARGRAGAIGMSRCDARQQISRRAIQERLDFWTRKLGLAHIHPHQLRHSYATRLANANIDSMILKDLMGHDDLATTRRYFHFHDHTLARGYFSAMEFLNH